MALCPTITNISTNCSVVSKTLKKNQIPFYDTFGPFPDETILSSIDRVLFFLGVKRVQRFFNLPQPIAADQSSSDCSQISCCNQNEKSRSCSTIASKVTIPSQAEACQTSKMLQLEDGCQTSRMQQLGPQTACQTSKVLQQGATCQTSHMFNQIKNSQSFDPSEAFKALQANPSEVIKALKANPSEAIKALQANPSEALKALKANPSEALKALQANPSEALKALQSNPSEALKALHANQRSLSFSQSQRSSQAFPCDRSFHITDTPKLSRLSQPSPSICMERKCSCSKCRGAQNIRTPPCMSVTNDIPSTMKNSAAVSGGNSECSKKVALPLKRSFSLCSLACRKMKHNVTNMSMKHVTAKWIWSRLKCYKNGTKVYEVFKNSSICCNPADVEVENNPVMIFVVLPNNVIVPFEYVPCHNK